MTASEGMWHETIRDYEQADAENPPPERAVVFYGSSSVTLWRTARSFPEVETINRGFGGSTVADAVRYVHRVVTPYKPSVVVFYSGDNDLAGSATPKLVAAEVAELVRRIHDRCPETRIVLISVKPSPIRAGLMPRFVELNELMHALAEQDPRLVFVNIYDEMLGPDGQPRPELYSDGLHMTLEGYEIWDRHVRPHLA